MVFSCRTAVKTVRRDARLVVVIFKRRHMVLSIQKAMVVTSRRAIFIPYSLVLIKKNE